MEQAYLVGIVVDFVQKMLPRFKETDIIYVRSMRASKVAVMNVQCRSVVVAGLVKSTFASLVTQTNPPPFSGNGRIYACIKFVRSILQSSNISDIFLQQ